MSSPGQPRCSSAGIRTVADGAGGAHVGGAAAPVCIATSEWNLEPPLPLWPPPHSIADSADAAATAAAATNWPWPPSQRQQPAAGAVAVAADGVAVAAAAAPAAVADGRQLPQQRPPRPHCDDAAVVAVARPQRDRRRWSSDAFASWPALHSNRPRLHRRHRATAPRSSSCRRSSPCTERKVKGCLIIPNYPNLGAYMCITHIFISAFSKLVSIYSS